MRVRHPHLFAEQGMRRLQATVQGCDEGARFGFAAKGDFLPVEAHLPGAVGVGRQGTDENVHGDLLVK